MSSLARAVPLLDPADPVLQPRRARDRPPRGGPWSAEHACTAGTPRSRPPACDRGRRRTAPPRVGQFLRLRDSPPRHGLIGETAVREEQHRRAVRQREPEARSRPRRCLTRWCVHADAMLTSREAPTSRPRPGATGLGWRGEVSTRRATARSIPRGSRLSPGPAAGTAFTIGRRTLRKGARPQAGTGPPRVGHQAAGGAVTAVMR